MNPVDAAYLVEYIEKSNYKPNAWEVGFLKDIKKKKIDIKCYLSAGQGDKLQEIYRRSQGG